MAMIKIILESDTLPMELDEIKQFLKVDYDDENENNIIIRAFKSAIKQCELMTGQTIIEKCYQYSIYNEIEKYIKLIYGPVKSIEGIKMIKNNNKEVSIEANNYFFDDVSYKIFFKNKPNDYYRLDVKYTAGMVEISDDLKQAILFHTTKIFEDKTGYSPIPKASYNIYKRYKTQRL